MPGTAVYGMYAQEEKKLYFNAKVFKNEAEALVYILHEIKHELDHYGETIGFETNHTNIGINEGAAQRFATDMAEEILKIKFPRKSQLSLGINLNTHLDEYQIEDKLNELFCMAMGIDMKDFIRMQNDPQKEEYNKLIDKFNQYANYDVFRDSLDGIYKIQEETWFDEKGNLLDVEKQPTFEQTGRAFDLILKCKKELLNYAKKNNADVVPEIEKEIFTGVNKYGEIVRDCIDNEKIFNETSDIFENTMTDEKIVRQADYINYHQNIMNQIINNINLQDDSSVIFITEFGYENENLNKVVYFRTGNLYKRAILPMLEHGKIDIANITIDNVNDLTEIKDSIQDYEAEFGVIANAKEYAKILELTNDEKKAKSILNKWNYFLSKQDELEEIRKSVEKQRIAFNN